MSGDWPPEGYSEPRVYHKNERYILALGVAIAGLFAVPALFPIQEGIDAYRATWSSFAHSLGIPYLTTGVVEAVSLILGMCAVFRVIIVPVHEAIHYSIGLLLDLNPKYGYEKTLFFKNPMVVALSTEISVWENMVMVIAPFVTIGLLSWGLVQVSGGLVAGVAAVILWMNSAASAQDLYHYIRLLRMNPDAKFANFKEGDTIRTEYVVPEQ
jgi:hypothetical protein